MILEDLENLHELYNDEDDLRDEILSETGAVPNEYEGYLHREASGNSNTEVKAVKKT